MLIIGVDPGGTTGICALRPPLELLAVSEEKDRAAVTAWIRLHKPDAVVIEEFRPHEGLPPWAPLPAPKVIALLESDERLNVVRQSPSIKRHIPDALLRAAGLYQVGKPHANDAIRHAAYYAWLKLGFVQNPEMRDVYARYIENVENSRNKYYFQNG